ncbi:MAG: flagellar hook-length control protein FliK [Candidatus Coatesbacteria bacterium]|nr:flagellar hook-length control protein FliK [Candidatus Coatesbacteria bacterium]
MSIVGGIDRLIVGQMRILMKDQDTLPSLSLKVGDLLKGKVLKLLPDGRALISIKGANILTRPKMSLAPGEEIFAKVQSLGSEITLGLLSKQAKLQNDFLQVLGRAWQQNSSISKLAEGLAKVATSLKSADALKSNELSTLDRILTLLTGVEGRDASAIAKRLVGLARALGLNHEASIARAVALGTPVIILKRQLQKTMKPNVEKLISMVSRRLSGEAKVEEGIKAQLERLLSLCGDIRDNVEFQQLANHFLRQRGAQLYMQMPLLWMGEDGLAELTVRSKKDDAKEGQIDPDNCQFSVSIELSGLGRVKAIAAVSKKRISCLLATEKKAIREFIAEHSQILADGLNAAGFEVSDIKAMVSSEPLERQFEAFVQMFIAQGPAFDVTV